MVPVRTASAINVFLSENFQFLEVKFSIYFEKACFRNEKHLEELSPPPPRETTFPTFFFLYGKPGPYQNGSTL